MLLTLLYAVVRVWPARQGLFQSSANPWQQRG
jgi:hypothetical protein